MSAQSRSLGWDEMVEDTVGVNLRGLKTIWTVFWDPKELFSAARDADWQGRRFGPTLRVYLLILAIVLFFQFIWADPNSQVAEAFRESTGGLDDIDPTFADEATVLDAVESYVVIYPVVLIIFSLIASCLVRVWGSGTPLLARVRLYFASVIPGAVLGIFSTLSLAAVPLEQAMVPTVAAVSIGGLADGVTAFRGLSPVHAVGARVWRSIVFALTNTTVLVTTSLVSTLLTLLFIAFKVGLEVGMAGAG
ncbi:MAG: hypothetical protein AAFQ22_10185 [Pseudomonadota bacterium]